MANYSQVPSEIEAARWAAFARLSARGIESLMARNEKLLDALQDIACVPAGMEERVRREQIFLKEHLQDRGMSLVGV